MRVYSIFNSIDGEVNQWGQGRFSTFIRFSGCNLRCNYCDTKYAQDMDCGKEMSVEEILEEVKKIGCRKITITGGEPLLQAEMKDFLYLLFNQGYKVSIESNGSFRPILNLPYCWVMDWKLASSGMSEYMNLENFRDLSSEDFVKFVIQDRLDYDDALVVIKRLRILECYATFAFSPAQDKIDPADLIEWMKEDKLFDVIVNLQLHKYMWGKNPGKEG